MSTRRKTPDARVPLVFGNTPAREWFNAFTRDEYVGDPATSATAGAASALPATPEGYITITVNDEQFVVPYYKP